MNIIKKLIPVEKIIALALKLGVLAEPMNLLAKGWVGAQGAKTQVCIVLAAGLIVAAGLGYVPWASVDPILQVLLGVGSAALLEKWGRVSGMVRKVSENVAEKAKTQKPN